ncbi:MAG: hypothetical protein ACE5EK_00700 [Nitrospinales bacterium]
MKDRRQNQSILFIICSLLVLFPIGSKSAGQTNNIARKISLKEYIQKSIPVKNPVDLTQVPRNKTFQVNHPHFILQFMFDGQDILGFILKRDHEYSLHMRWCFFRTCEETPHDYTVVIAAPSQSRNGKLFFKVSYPPGYQHDFQGVEFTAPK